MKKMLIGSVGALLITACASVPKEDPAEKAAQQAWLKSLTETKEGFGAYPSNYQEVVKNYMYANLKDPDSAKYVNFRDPAKDLKIVDMSKRIALFGYSTCVDINARNSYGGYTGAKKYWFLIKDGEVVDSLTPSSAGYNSALSNIMTQLVDATCDSPKVKQ